MSETPEFSRPLSLSRIGPEPFVREISASAAEREALARRFGLLGLDRLSATVELTRERGGTVLLSASYEAAFAQECVVTFDPVESVVAERFMLRYGAPELEPEDLGGDDGPAFEPVAGDAIDIGEAVAQEFSLALPLFPRAPGAGVETLGEAGDEAAGPFAGLHRLLGSPRS